MEHLLSWPQSLPLVHVNHSHRAKAVREIGICYGITNTTPIQAGCIIQMGESKTVYKYLLDMTDCETGRPKASRETAAAVLNALLQRMTETRRDFNAKMVLEDGPNRRELLAGIQVMPSGPKTFFFDANGNIVADKTDTLIKIQQYLTTYYAREDGPEFLLQDVSSYRPAPPAKDV